MTDQGLYADPSGGPGTTAQEGAGVMDHHTFCSTIRVPWAGARRS
jgi:hypothetical protein